MQVTSILSNPDQDPHLFEASPKTARALQGAALVVYNGADYDPSMEKLLAASKRSNRTTIVAAQLMGRKSGDNPHLWYDPKTMPAVAKAVNTSLVTTDPAHKGDYDARLDRFLNSLKPVDDKVAALKGHYEHVPLTATEPVFGYMTSAIGLDRRNERFQLATMNDTEPSAADVASFETDLTARRVHVPQQPGEQCNDPAHAEAREQLARTSHQRDRDFTRWEEFPAVDGFATRRTIGRAEALAC
ncbi:ABC-type Zn uptake system ZnuABC Zn-binding protein ZnuA [Paraburkholderia sp. MM5496-R1]